MNQMKKIAVFGTCFSRNFLSSAPYFNPDYKEYFNCVFTQFHSSIITIMSEPLTINLDRYDDIPLENKKFVVADFEKKFWKEMSKNSPDYLVVDLYTDALRSVGWMTVDCAVTISPIVEQSKLLNDLEFEFILDHSNQKKYKEKFRESLIRFKNKVLSFISEEQLILNKGRLAKTYFDEKREIKKFHTPEVIDEYNQFWEELEEIFIEQFPRSKVINMREMGFIGDVRYPFGLSVSHYQREYYREMFKKVIELTSDNVGR